MNRRAPVRSVLAERRLFSNGGMLPISTPFQNTPSGILASSPPLIEAVSQEIVAPFTGGAMPMAQGGVAKFQEGGFAAGTLGSQYGFDFNPQGIEIEMVPSLTPIRTYIQDDVPGVQRARHRGVVATFDPDNPTPMSYGDILNETASEKVLRLFPEWLKNTQTLTVAEELAPMHEARAETGDVFSRVQQAAMEAAATVKQYVVGKWFQDMPQDAEAVFKTLFGKQARIDIPTENWFDAIKQTRSVIEMIQRRPDLREDITLFAREAVLKNPALTQDGLAEAVAMRLSDKHEGDPNIGIGTAEQERAELLREHRAPEPVSPEQAARFQEIITGLTSADQTRDLATDGDWQIGDDYRKGPAWRPDPIADPPQGEEGPPTAEVPIPAAAVTPDDAPAVTPDAVPAAADLPRGEDEDWYRQNMYDDAAAVAETFDKPDMTPEQAEKDVKFYVDEFKKSMPDYEGASREEQGWAIFEAGMRIMAGQSPHAMTNISAGLKGLGTEFAKDAKEKRAWDRQVDLSATRYGLQNVARDRAELRADARAGGKLHSTVWRVAKGKTFERHGRTLTEDDTVILTIGEIQDGSVDLSKLETESSVLAGIAEHQRHLARQLDALNKTVTDPAEFEGTKKTYMADSARVRTNIATQGLLKNALVALNAKDVTGIKGAAKDWILRLSNSLGLKEFSEDKFGKLDTKAEYVDFTERATTKFIEGLISEGGKISDFERQLARELSGAIGAGAFDGVLADPDILETKILSFIASLEADTTIRLRTMGLTEKTWGTRYATIEPGRVSYGQMLKEAAGPLSFGRLSSQMIPGSVNWTDIISVDPETNAVLGLKPRDEW
jgi:hypothetical protein